MTRTAVRMAFAVGLIAAGWIAGKAQTPGPAFELVVGTRGRDDNSLRPRLQTRVGRTRRQPQFQAGRHVRIRVQWFGALWLRSHRGMG